MSKTVKGNLKDNVKFLLCVTLFLNKKSDKLKKIL